MNETKNILFIGQLHNFNRYKSAEMDFAGGVYDLTSIMHYGNYAFSKNRKPTMLSVKEPLRTFGQVAKLSDTDILQLNAVYDCKNSKYGRLMDSRDTLAHI